jgi:hypothetical protein
MKKIYFTREKLTELKKAYHKARIKGQTEFKFEGQDVLVAYAKYLIEHLDTKFKPHGSSPYTDEQLRQGQIEAESAVRNAHNRSHQGTNEHTH